MVQYKYRVELVDNSVFAVMAKGVYVEHDFFVFYNEALLNEYDRIVYIKSSQVKFIEKLASQPGQRSLDEIRRIENASPQTV